MIYTRMTTACLIPADLLVYRLLELLVVQDGPHFAVAVARPEGSHHLNSGLTHILSGKLPELCWNVNCLKKLLSATVVVFYWTRIVGLSFIPAVHCFVVLCIFFNVIQRLKKFLVRSLEDISPESGKKCSPLLIAGDMAHLCLSCL